MQLQNVLRCTQTENVVKNGTKIMFCEITLKFILD